MFWQMCTMSLYRCSCWPASFAADVSGRSLHAASTILVHYHVQGKDGTTAARITRHSKGCSCRKSHCLKKYCECFQAGIFCGNTCRCKDCRNFEGSAALASAMDIADAAATARLQNFAV
jgi:hypothetical protein